MCWGKLMLPKLQTAISSLFVFSVISVQRFEECTVPTCPCGDLILHGSLNVIHGCPVSKSIVKIFLHRSSALIFLKSLISPEAASFSYSSYFFSNALPYKSCSSGASEGEKSVHSSFFISLFMNRSGIQLAVFIS